MTSVNSDPRGGKPLARHPDDVLLPSDNGNVVVYLGKEALLSWFTRIRTEAHREVANRLYHLGHPRVLFKTNVYQLVEVFTKVRYEKSARSVVQLREKLDGSVVRILHGGDDWSNSHQSWTPKDVFRASSELFDDRPRLRFSFPEAALVLGLTRKNQKRDVPIYLFTFDGTLATLADTFGVPVLPYSTPLRDDSGR